jgi:iron(III) transport system substrate-binding protein
MMRNRSPWLIGALLLPLVLNGCGIIDAFDGDQAVRVYSGRHYDLEEAFEEYATETGIDVEFLYGVDAELRERLRTEGEDTLADGASGPTLGRALQASADHHVPPGPGRSIRALHV